MRHEGLVLAAACLALAGCATADLDELAASPNYPLGYNDGCQTGTASRQSFSDKSVRDEYLFDNDKGYRFGWRQGFQACGAPTETENVRRGRVNGDHTDGWK